MTLTRSPGPTSRALVVRLDDGTSVTVRGRRAAIIRHLLTEALYLDDPAMGVGKLEISWDDRRKLDVNCTRYGRELWGDLIGGITERVPNGARPASEQHREP